MKRIYILRDHSLLDLSTLENRSDYKFRIQLEHLSLDTDPQEYLATHYVDALFSLDGVPGEFYPKGGPVKIESSTSIKKDVTIDGHAYYNSFAITYKNDGKHYIAGCFDIVISYDSAPKPRVFKNSHQNLLKKVSILSAFRLLIFNTFKVKIVL